MRSHTRAIVFAIAASAGCHTVGSPPAVHTGGAGVEFAYSGGRGVQAFPHPPEAVRPAVLSALGDLGIEKVRQSRDGTAFIIEGATADGRRASLTLRPHPAGSRVSARVGWFGDEPLSQALLERVAVRLGTLPPASVPAQLPSRPGRNPFFSRAAVPDEIMLKNHAEAPYRSSPVSD